MSNYKVINIDTSDKYSVYIGSDINLSKLLSKEFANIFTKDFSKVVIISDSKVDVYFKLDCNLKLDSNCVIHTVSINISESLKNRESKEKLEDKLFELNCGRDTLLIAIGGGVLLDLVGFVAATYNRGIPVIYIPTTLLAMVDASVGGKTAINTKYGKNLIGAFKQPSAVIIDIDFLNTLSDYEYVSALAEVIKMAALFSLELFEYLENKIANILVRDRESLLYIIYQSIYLKKLVVEQDEHEASKRELLNFGHTIGHAIEKQMDYKISHGLSVALGILIESKISVKLNILSKQDLSRICNLLHNSFKNINIDFGFNFSPGYSNSFLDCLILDKKSKNSIPHFVLLQSIGGFYAKDNKYSFAVNKDVLAEIPELLEGCELICQSV